MNPTILTELMVSVWIIWFVLFWALPRVRRDNFRTDIRLLRDHLFNYMRENGHSFDTPEYRATRQTLNGIIRMSNQMTPLKFIVLAARHHHDSSDVDSNSAKSTDCPLMRELEIARVKAMVRLLKFLFLEGILGRSLQFLLWLLPLVTGGQIIKRWVLKKGTGTLEDFRQLGEPPSPPRMQSLFHA